MDNQCIQHKEPGEGPCFPPTSVGQADFRVADLEAIYIDAPYCMGHLQKLMTDMMRIHCQLAGVELLVDQTGRAYIDPEITAQWEAEAEAQLSPEIRVIRLTETEAEDQADC